LILRTLLLILALAAPAFAETFPAHTTASVYDFANVLTAQQEAELTALTDDLRASHGAALVVVTMASMQDYRHYGEIEPYATKLFNTWGIGDAKRNDGILMLVAVKDRQMRIELGSGYSFLWNSRMQKIIDTDMLPAFKQSHYASGIATGANSVATTVRAYLAPPGASIFTKIGRWFLLLFAIPATWIAGAIGSAGAAPIVAWRRHRNKPRACPVDGTKMVRLEEEWDDNHLQPGQLTEERIGSVDYDVWQCKKCQHVTIEAYKSWFTRYGACRECGFRTVQGTENVVVSPTYTSTGTAEVDYHCMNCDARYTVTRTIPMKTRSESSSSGGSSFGGGSSSGGGASGRW